MRKTRCAQNKRENAAYVRRPPSTLPNTTDRTHLLSVIFTIRYRPAAMPLPSCCHAISPLIHCRYAKKTLLPALRAARPALRQNRRPLMPMPFVCATLMPPYAAEMFIRPRRYLLPLPSCAIAATTLRSAHVTCARKPFFFSIIILYYFFYFHFAISIFRYFLRLRYFAISFETRRAAIIFHVFADDYFRFHFLSFRKHYFISFDIACLLPLITI
jgi:hypothetical protein